MFPDVLKRLNDDVTWTTNLGNAFLAQQQDVMDAVQRMRAKAEQAGKLASTPQENVVTDTENGQPAIEIVPTDPDIMYVPVYDPAWIWGPAVWYPYPRWWWPPRSVMFGGLGFGFGVGINVGFFFGAGWHGWGGWGWHPGWGTHNVIVNNTFIHQYNFNTVRINNVHGAAAWVHDPGHRQGVPYSRPELNSQYRGAVRQNWRRGPMPNKRATLCRARVNASAIARSRKIPRRRRTTASSEGNENGRAAQTHAEHGYSSMGPSRSAPAARAPAARPAGGGGGRGGRH